MVGMTQNKRRIFLNEPHLVTPTQAGLQSFQTDLIAPLKECRVNFNPVQEGTGDPSPTNIRSISGWNSVDIIKCGKNLFDNTDIVWVNRYIRNDNGVKTSDNAANYTETFIPVSPNTIYTLSGKINATSGTIIRIYFSDEKQEWISRTSQLKTVDSVSFTTPGNCKFIQIQHTRVSAVDPSTWQLEKGSATLYEPYQGSINPIDWSSSAGTLYGGYVDLVAGELVETLKLFTITGSESNAKYLWSAYTFAVSDENTADNNGGYNIAACSHTNKRGYGSEPFNDRNKSPLITCSKGHQIRYRDYDHFTDLESAQSYLQAQYNNGTPVQVVVRLINPVIYQLSPQTIKTLRGVNNIWSDAGDVEIKYWTH